MAAILAYLAVWGPVSGLLLIQRDGSPPFQGVLGQGLHKALQQSLCNGCSFRIGAATTAAAAGVPDSTTKMPGRWQRGAYSMYIHTLLDLMKALKMLMPQCMYNTGWLLLYTDLFHQVGVSKC